MLTAYSRLWQDGIEKMKSYSEPVRDTGSEHYFFDDFRVSLHYTHNNIDNISGVGVLIFSPNGLIWCQRGIYCFELNNYGSFYYAIDQVLEEAEKSKASGFKNLAQKGIMVFAPYGYKKVPRITIDQSKRQSYTWTFENDPVKSAVVSKLFTSYLNGKSLRMLMKELISSNIPSPTGKIGIGSWSAATIKNILSNPAYAGRVRWGKKLGSKYREGRNETGKQKRVYTNSSLWVVSEGQNFAPVINQETYQKVQDRLRLRGKVSGRQLSSKSLLIGLVWCGECNLRAYCKTRKVRKNQGEYIRSDYIDQSYFRGLNCRRHLISSDKLEKLVIEHLDKRLKLLSVSDIRNQFNIENRNLNESILSSIILLDRQLKQHEQRNSRLMELYLSGSIDKDQFNYQKIKLDAESTTLLQEKSRLHDLANNQSRKLQANKLLKSLLEMFSKEKNPNIKKEMIQRIISKIIIYKDRVEVLYNLHDIEPQMPNVKPHPCGYLGDKSHECKCSQSQIMRYQKRVSGPILDRIDIHLDVQAVKVEKLTEKETSALESSKIIRKRVQKARDIQKNRFNGTKITANSEISSRDMKKFCVLSDECLELLKLAVTRLNLSGRSYHRTIKLSRTIADLAGDTEIKKEHIAEALQYRPKNDTL